MFGYRSPARAGQLITEGLLNHALGAANKLENRPLGGEDGFDLSRWRAARKPPPALRYMVRVYADTPPEGEVAGDPAYPDVGSPNACIQFWNDELGGWDDDPDGDVYVTPAYGLPLTQDSYLWAEQDPGSGRLVPSRQPETEMVQLLTNVPDANGYLQGVVRRWNSLEGRWVNGENVYVIDANQGAAGAAPQQSALETPRGAVDGVNRTFALSRVPAPPSSAEVFVDGLLRLLGADFTLSGSVLTFAAPPHAGAVIQARYAYLG